MEAEALSEDAWSEIPLSALASANITYGVVQPGSPVANGVPMIRVNNFEGHSLDLRDVTSISPEIESKYERTRVRAGDILVTVVGSVGQVAIAPSRVHGWNIARAVALIRPIDPDKTRWIAHFLRSPVAQHRMGIAANTTVQTTVNLKDLRSMLVPMPPEPVRRGISKLLGALDDRIDLLRQTNTTLDAIAQALFKSWFVDFDPVRAKTEGREPDAAAQGSASGAGGRMPGAPMDAATAALFPNEFETSDLGPIPKGWHMGTLEEMSYLNAMSWSSRNHPASVAYVDLSTVYENRIGTADVLPFAQAPSRARRALRDGDTIVGTVRPGNRAFAYIHCPAPNLTGSTGFAVLSPKGTALAPFVYLAATSTDSIERLANLADGGAYPAVRPDVVLATPVAIPPTEVTKAFANVAAPMLRKIGENRCAETTLTELRDTLLPRLISGKLRLPEAEREVEAIT